MGTNLTDLTGRPIGNGGVPTVDHNPFSLQERLQLVGRAVEFVLHEVDARSEEPREFLTPEQQMFLGAALSLVNRCGSEQTDCAKIKDESEDLGSQHKRCASVSSDEIQFKRLTEAVRDLVQAIGNSASVFAAQGRRSAVRSGDADGLPRTAHTEVRNIFSRILLYSDHCAESVGRRDEFRAYWISEFNRIRTRYQAA